MKPPRLLPVVLLAALGLFGLKAAGILAGTGAAPASAAAAHGEEAAPAAEDRAEPPLGLSTTPPAETTFPDPRADTEAAILARLAERRAELDARAAELDLREQLLAAAETRMDERLAELQAIEARINAAAEAEEAARTAELASLVSMYETMRPSDAAAIFDRLDQAVLLRIVTQMNPRKMAPILAAMSPQLAGQITAAMTATSAVEDGAGPARAPSLADLPQIAPAT